MSNDTSVLIQDPATDTDAIYFKDATELATLIRTKRISSREVVQAHLDRIAAVNPKVNAIVTLMADDALRGADLADKAVKAGAELGPLHGVPFTIKDAIDTAGVLTQRASKSLPEIFPQRTPPSLPVSKLQAGFHWPRQIFRSSLRGRRRTTW
jgi:Asp-tRNA(Asn)/Glu-tRNA(Gln) amidotransferase A subunit family amidase